MYRRAARGAVRAILEELEQHVVLRVSASTLVGQMLTPGAQFTGHTTDTTSSDTVKTSYRVAGLATVPGGQRGTEVDVVQMTHSGTSSSTITGDE